MVYTFLVYTKGRFEAFGYKVDLDKKKRSCWIIAFFVWEFFQHWLFRGHVIGGFDSRLGNGPSGVGYAIKGVCLELLLGVYKKIAFYRAAIFDKLKDKFLITGVAEAIPLKSKVADIVFCINVLDHCKNRKKPITIAFLGIDGTGKSTHAEKIASWLQENGIKCKVIPFHKWVFADMLKKRFGRFLDKGREEESLNPYAPRYSLPALIKPLIALIDNILIYYLSKWKYRDYDVLLFDRFICATFIKFKALNYRVDWIRPIWDGFKPEVGVLFDIPVEKSTEIIRSRGNHILYTPGQLSIERKEYTEMAKKHGWPVFNTSESFELVHERVKKYLEKGLISQDIF